MIFILLHLYNFCLFLMFMNDTFGSLFYTLAQWLTSNKVGRINEVNQRRTRLVLGWVIVVVRVTYLDMSPVNQVDSAFHSS